MRIHCWAGEIVACPAESVSGTMGTQSYGYDGEGRRARKTVGALTTYYVYDAGGDLAAEYEALGSGAASPCTTCYVTGDHLGSTRALWDEAGLKARYDYLPFGEAVARDRNGRGSLQCAAGVATCYDGPGGVAQRFTGKERDGETGLDYFGARYMAAALGRFTSPDPNSAGASLFDPQSWNGYSYVNNRPLTHVDSDGRVPIPIITGAVGGLAGGIVGGAFEAIKQYRQSGEIGQWGKVWTAAGGGALAGAIAGATLGVGSGAGLAVGAGEALVANASANVIGGIAQRAANEAHGYDTPAEEGAEKVNIAVDAITGGMFGFLGGKGADKLYPIPNVTRKISLLRHASRRSTRPSRIKAAERNAKLQAGSNAVVGGVTGGLPTELTKWVWELFWTRPPAEKKKEPNTRICYETGECNVQ